MAGTDGVAVAGQGVHREAGSAEAGAVVLSVSVVLARQAACSLVSGAGGAANVAGSTGVGSVEVAACGALAGTA